MKYGFGRTLAANPTGELRSRERSSHRRAPGAPSAKPTRRPHDRRSLVYCEANATHAAPSPAARRRVARGTPSGGRLLTIMDGWSPVMPGAAEVGGGADASASIRGSQPRVIPV